MLLARSSGCTRNVIVKSASLRGSVERPPYTLYTTQVFQFSTEPFTDLRASVASQLRCPPECFGQLHLVEAERNDAPKKNCYRTRGCRSNPEAVEQLVRAYERLICTVVCNH